MPSTVPNAAGDTGWINDYLSDVIQIKWTPNTVSLIQESRSNSGELWLNLSKAFWGFCYAMDTVTLDICSQINFSLYINSAVPVAGHLKHNWAMLA